MAKLYYMWNGIFALTTLVIIAGLINSSATITGNATSVTGYALLSPGEMYSLSWLIVVTFFLVSAYIVFFHKKKKLDLSPGNVEETLDKGLVRIKEKVKKYL